MANLQADRLRLESKMPYVIGVDFGFNEERKDMCYEGAAPQTATENRLVREVEEMRRNHLGAPTERFIEMARELGRNDHLRELTAELSYQLGDARYEAKRMAEQAAYSDNETDKANRRSEGWQQRALRAERLHEQYKEKQRKANAKKTTRRTK